MTAWGGSGNGSGDEMTGAGAEQALKASDSISVTTLEFGDPARIGGILSGSDLFPGRNTPGAFDFCHALRGLDLRLVGLELRLAQVQAPDEHPHRAGQQAEQHPGVRERGDCWADAGDQSGDEVHSFTR